MYGRSFGKQVAACVLFSMVVVLLAIRVEAFEPKEDDQSPFTLFVGKNQLRGSLGETPSDRTAFYQSDNTFGVSMSKWREKISVRDPDSGVGLSVDARQISSLIISARRFAHNAGACAGQQEMRLILRDGGTLTVCGTLTDTPQFRSTAVTVNILGQPGEVKIVRNDSSAQKSSLHGISVEPLNSAEKQQLWQATGPIWGDSAVKITQVATGSPAANAGLRVGDWIIAMITGGRDWDWWTSAYLSENRERWRHEVATATPSDFDRIAAQCTPDCLIGVIDDDMKKDMHHLLISDFVGGGFVPIGELGTHFVAVYDSYGRTVVGFKDLTTALVFESKYLRTVTSETDDYELVELYCNAPRGLYKGPVPRRVEYGGDCDEHQAGESDTGASPK